MKEKMEIRIKAIPHSKQRYPTCGDYWTDDKGRIQIRVSKMIWRYEMLVAVHELIEQFLCKCKNVSEKEIDQFDIFFESQRKKGNTDEPGDDIRAPYFRQHQVATMIEKRLAIEIGLDWSAYESYINKL